MLTKNRAIWWGLVLVLVVASARADEYSLNPASGADTVYFRSTARLEFIEGKTTGIVGSFNFDPANPVVSISGRLRVDLRTLKTGIDTRDGHMRDNHLHTDKFPFAYFELTGVTGLPPKLLPDTSYAVDAKGMFYIHGLKRQLKATTEIVLHQGDSDNNSLSFRSTFQLRLDDYKIERPKALFLKLAETIEIVVVATGFTGTPSSTVDLPDWK